jgi:hypothetical protein
MKRANPLAAAVILCLLCAVGIQAQQSGTTGLTDAAGTAASAVPRLVRFNGTLADATGKPLADPVDVPFEFFSEQSGSSVNNWQLLPHG